MYIEKIEAEYFLGFGEYSCIEFDKETVVGVIGSYDKSKEQSNRAGKSSFLEIILYNLYGRSRAKTEKDTINWNYEDANMKTKITYNFSGKRIVITRGRTSGNDLILDVQGLEGERKRDVQGVIDSLVGMSYEDFVRLNFFMQDDIHTFIKSGSTDMSKVLGRWIKTDFWEDYKKKADSKIKDIERAIMENETYIKNNSGVDLNSIRMDSKSKEGLETNILSLKERVAVLVFKQERINGVLDLKEEAFKKEKKTLRLKDRVEKLNSKIEKVMCQMDECKLNEKEYDSLSKKIRKVSTKKLNEYNKTSRELLFDIKSLEKDYRDIHSKIEKIDSGEITCPVTERRCDLLKSDYGKKIKEELEGELFHIDSYLIGKRLELPKIREKISKIEKTIELNKEYESEMADLDYNWEDRQEALDEYDEQKAEYLEEIKELKVDISKIEKRIKKIDIDEDYEGEIEELNSIIEDETKKVGEYIRKIKDGNLILKSKKEAKKILGTLNTELVEYRFISFMFSKRGISSNQIEGAFEEVQNDANYILKSKLNTDIQIEFKNYKELQEKEKICPVCGFVYPKGYRKTECDGCGNERGKKKKDELNLKLFVGGKEANFDMDSGAGKVMTSVAIRIALIRMLTRRAGIGCSLLFLDEIFASLDAINRKNVMALILDVLVNDFGFTQIFCISHNEDISRMLQRNIKITRYEKNSIFEWED